MASFKLQSKEERERNDPAPAASRQPMSERAELVACLTEPPSAEGLELRGLKAQWLEVRADLVGDVDVDWLRQRFDGRLLFTLRSRAEGGRGSCDLESRRQAIERAVPLYDAVDLEADRDLEAETLDLVPAEKRFLSAHVGAVDEAELWQRFHTMSQVPARLYKLVVFAKQAGEELPPLELLRRLERPDVAAFAAGEVGTWTRLLAPRWGAPFVYGSLGATPAAAGQPSISRLIADFGLPRLYPVERLFGIVGCPVAHSLSPRLHNGAYRALDLPYLYLPFHAENFGDFWLEVVESGLFDGLCCPLSGLSVTAPHKAAALAIAGVSSPLAQRTESANTLFLDGGVWEAETTDPRGVVGPLEAKGVPLRDQPALVVGCGGAGRAAAYGLYAASARLYLTNRNEERGRRLAERMKVPFVPWEKVDPGQYRVLVHATSLGSSPDDPLPFSVSALSSDAVVVDLVYRAEPTRLIQEVQARSLETVEGREVLLWQALDQFRLMVGRELALDLGRQLLQLPPAAATKRIESDSAEGGAA